ncbi:MAG TPA: DUF2723 domain-containing protein [Gemmatimonadales bacterium]|nr:DUF2723 domain-containing protein [Gemmatimonadales bacterium]
MTQPSGPTPPQEPRPPYFWAGLTALGVLLIYLVTLAPTTAFWDTSEYLAAAYVLGIPHPPGNPLFVVMAHAFGALPLAESYAVRINLFAAVTSALSAGLWFLVAERWLRAVVPVRWARLAAAAAGVLVGATAWTVWNQSTVNEKVYTLSLLSIALVTWLAVRWGDDAPGDHRDRWLVLIAYVLALTSTNHMMGVLAAPAVAAYVLWTDRRIVTRGWAVALAWTLALAVSSKWAAMVDGGAEGILLLAVTAVVLGYGVWRDGRNPLLYLALGAVVVGVSLNYVFLPMRAAQFPPINEGEPTTWQALIDVLNREQYGKPSVLERQAAFTAQLHNYWQYFSWQFARDWGRWSRVAAAVFTALGLLGAATLWRRDRRAAAASTALMATLTVLLVFYLNFKYGYSLYPELGDLPREVRERDYFFVASFAAFGVWVAVGLGALLRGVADVLRDRGSETGRWAVSTPVLALALVPLLGNRVTASRAGETLARDFAVDLLESVEPYGILITAGDNDTFPLWFAQEVLGVRRDVTLANLSLMNTRWHLKQLRRREVPDFDPGTAAPIWRDAPRREPEIELRDRTDRSTDAGPTDGRSAPPAKPPGPILGLAEGAIDSLPELLPVPARSGLEIGEIQVAFGDEYLQLQDIATLALIKENLGKRPIYFSWSAGGYPDRTLGLTGYLVTHGLVRKLAPRQVAPSDSVVLSRGLGYLNIPRTKALLREVYHWRSAGRDRPAGWVDDPSASILHLYSVVYGAAASTFRERGDNATAAFADSVAKEVREEIRGD